ncbi:ABATE domain-containing protein [Candidatus Acetothermia bacterium]|nr:ABATE domain-containing protein [Candidatus Acetothermia bacterium]MBI3643463.1 ABATE domain-containing protein [Candidatus Acetothermia bacterium]
MTNTKRDRVPVLIAGVLCLDFVNSLYWRATETPIEWFNEYPDLISWSQSLKILSVAEARKLLLNAQNNAAKASLITKQAIQLREAIYQIFFAIIQERLPAKADFRILNSMLGKSISQLQIAPSATGFSWQWQGVESHLDSVLWPIARSAADLLTSRDWPRVGQCPGDGCGWLFLDKSRNHTRRWCAMEHCGHKTNAILHYHRKQRELAKR